MCRACKKEKESEDGEEEEEGNAWKEVGGRRKGLQYSRVVEHTPATVGIAGAKTLPTAPILTTRLHGDSGELEQHNGEKAVKTCRTSSGPLEGMLF